MLLEKIVSKNWVESWTIRWNLKFASDQICDDIQKKAPENYLSYIRLSARVIIVTGESHQKSKA